MQHPRRMAWVAALSIAFLAVWIEGTIAAGFGPYFVSDCSPVASEADTLFNETFVTSFELSMAPEDFDRLVNDTTSQQSYSYSKASANATLSSGAVADLGPVGIRVRGKSSRSAAKHSFTLKFDKYSKDQKLSGVSKLALRAEYFDPTVVREGVVLSFFEAMGVCTQRKSYAVLTINGVYMGLYLQTELIETDWLEARFPDALPLLYKTNVWTGEYQGEHQLFSPAFELYTKYVNGGKSPIKDGGPVADYSPLFFVEKIVNAFLGGVLDEASFVALFESRFDVSGFLRSLASEVVLSSWDDWASNYNNFYMAYVPNLDQVRYIPYDEDLTLGVGEIGEESPCPLYQWGCKKPMPPPVRAMLQVEAWNEQFTLYAAVAAEKLGGDPAVAAYINDRKAFVADLATRDYYRSDKVLFPPSDWEKGFNSTVCNGTKCQPGLFPWIAAWSQNITAQLLQVGSGPYLTSVSSTSDDIVFASAANITAVIDVAKAGDAPTATALVSYDAGKTFEEHPMSVTQVADHTYTAVASVAAISTTCTDGTEYGLGVYAPYRIQVTAATNTTLFPAEPRYYSFFCWTGKTGTHRSAAAMAAHRLASLAALRDDDNHGDHEWDYEWDY